MKIERLERLKLLVSRFEENESQYINSGSSYNETELRTDRENFSD